MYINKLNLRAFGKFLHKKVYLENKFNIIYGENEAGKSTIHNFIEAIFYGYDEDEEGLARFNKFKPWNYNLYKGSININDAVGDRYNISKDFLLNTIQVYKKQEEEMLETNIQTPGEHFFNMNKISFNNTVSVRQLGNKTEKELADELKNKIINLSKTKDETISIDRILQRLNSIKEEAGDESDKKTLLGQYALRLAELKASKDNTINANRQVMFLVMETKKIKSKIQELNFRINELEKELKDYELSLDKDRFIRAEPIKKEIDEINEKLKNYTKEYTKKYSDSEYNDALNIENALNFMYSEKSKLQKEKEVKEEKLENLLLDLSNKITDDFDIDKFNIDYSKFKNNLDKIKNLEATIKAGNEKIGNIKINEINEFIDNYNKIEEINRKIEMTNILLDNGSYKKIKKYRSNNILHVLFLLLLALLLIGGIWWLKIQYSDVIKSFIDSYYVINESANIAAGTVTALAAILFAFLIKPRLNKIKYAKNEIDSMECEFADNTILIQKLNSQKDEIISHTSCKNIEELTSQYNKLVNEKALYEEKNKLLNYDVSSLKSITQENLDIQEALISNFEALEISEINDENIKLVNDAFARRDFTKENVALLNLEIEELNQKIIKLDKEISFEEKRLEMILKSNNIQSIVEFKDEVTSYNNYSALISNKEYKEAILYKIIGDESYEDLKNKTKLVSFYEIKKIDKKEHQLNIFKLNDEKSRLLKEIDSILAEIEEIEKNTRSLAEIEEEIEFYENKINNFKKKIKVAQIAGKKILKISDSIKGDFMPLLRKSISDNFSYLTSGKYSEVVIDEDMNITVLEANNNDRNIELESLSGGTLDQLYLSLRVGLGNILSGNKSIPLIFDDSFVQYDSKRLKNSIEMLAKESERRQIILFTCQEREAELAKQMNIKFNYIKLG